MRRLPDWRIDVPNVILSKEARKDIQAIRDYIRDDLSNPDAARDMVKALRKTVSSLKQMPERGVPLDTILSVHTEYRFLVCNNYRVFYLHDRDTVEVVRILHTLQDYMRALFL